MVADRPGHHLLLRSYEGDLLSNLCAPNNRGASCPTTCFRRNGAAAGAAAHGRDQRVVGEERGDAAGQLWRRTTTSTLVIPSMKAEAAQHFFKCGKSTACILVSKVGASRRGWGSAAWAKGSKGCPSPLVHAAVAPGAVSRWPLPRRGPTSPRPRPRPRRRLPPPPPPPPPTRTEAANVQIPQWMRLAGGRRRGDPGAGQTVYDQSSTW